MTVFANDEAMVSWFQKLLGYLITGEVDERLFFVLVGITHTTHHINGKGIVGNLISCLLNAMVSKLDKSVLLDGIDTNQLAKLSGCRVAHINGASWTHLTHQDKMDTNAIRQLIYGDSITHKCLVTANQVPRLINNEDVDNAHIRTRIMCIPFPAPFTNSGTPYVCHHDHGMDIKLVQHLPHLLTWVVQGAVKWYASKDLVTSMPKSVYTLENACTYSDSDIDTIKNVPHPLQDQETFQFIFEKGFSKYHYLNIMDNVFAEFLKTNVFRGKNYQLRDLFIDGCSVNSKRYFKFMYDGSPYLATVSSVAGYNTDWLTIKLCNVSFKYLTTANKLEPPLVSLSPSTNIPYLTSIVDAAKPYFSSARVSFNVHECRLDMKFFPKDTSKTPSMIVTYEPGYPFMDNEAEEWRFS